MFLLVILAVVSSVADNNNLGVTYTPQTICTLEGSTVRINCKYDHPAEFTILMEAWFYDHDKDNVYPENGTIVYHTDRSQVPSSYTNRVQFFGNKNKICDIKIRNVSRQESGYYKFRFDGGLSNKFTKLRGVTVTITGLIVQTTPETIKENDMVTLSCRANCSLPNRVFSWFRNGRPLKETSKDLQIQRVSTEDSGSYSCRAGNITSPERLLDVQWDVSCSGSWNLILVLSALLGIAVLVALALGVFIFVRERTKKTTGQKEDTQGGNETADQTYTSLDRLAVSEVYDTITQNK